jgi:peptidoglycan/LPS O-acetylase OafA/YrhL
VDAARPEVRAPHSERFPGFDGIRAVAVLMVLVSHSWRDVLRGGYIGVDLFFVLSGFLITTLLLRERARRGVVSLRNFYARRALRLLPALAVVLVAALIYSIVLASPVVGAATRTGILSTVAYVANWVRALGTNQTNGALGHTWSLSTEEQFYLLWPILLLAATRFRSVRWTFFACLGLIAVLWFWRAALQLHGASQDRVYFGLDTHADCLLGGCALALANHLGWLRRFSVAQLRTALVASFLYVAVFAFLEPGGRMPGTWNDYIPEAVMVTAAVTVVLVAPPRWLVSALDWRPIAFIGTISYGMYLWSFLIWTALSAYLAPGPLAVFIVFVATLGAATASYRWIERPALRLKARLAGAAQPQMAPVGDVAAATAVA